MAMPLVPALVEEAARGRQRLRSRSPRMAVLCGAASAEDALYFAATPEPSRSYHDVSGALTRLGAGEVRVVDITTSKMWLDQLDGIDLAVMNLHGEPGEDGTVQGCLRLHDIRFVGSGVEASVVSLNKALTKLIAHTTGVRSPAYAVYRDGELVFGAAALAGDRICKPLRGGSSLGVSRISGAQTPPATGEWIVEEFLPGDDVTVAVIEVAGRPVALPAVALRHPGEFYDVPAKMSRPAARKAVATRPPGLWQALIDCERLAAAMHAQVGARHISRSDFVVSGGDPYFLEINTVPGISAISNAAECAYAAGLDYDGFIALIISPALPDG
jgi:D-alanine-D-alanine ligase